MASEAKFLITALISEQTLLYKHNTLYKLAIQRWIKHLQYDLTMKDKLLTTHGLTRDMYIQCTYRIRIDTFKIALAALVNKITIVTLIQ